MPTACNFFIWEDKYPAYLIDNGFLDEFEFDPSSIRDMLLAIVETQMQIRQLQKELEGLRARRHQDSNNSWDKMIMLAVFIVAIGLVVALAFK